MTAPSKAPHASVTAITAGTGQSSTSRKYSAQKSHSANIEPTERSIPPTITTSAMPSTIKPISPAWRAVSASAAGEKKLSIPRLNAIATMISTITGIAVSVQRLLRISPSRWSGQYLAFSRTKASCIGGPSSLQLQGCAGHPMGSPALLVANYFFRSAKFQQAVLLSAFSLVIGIRVVYAEPFTEPGFAPDDNSHLIIAAMSAAWVGTS